MQLLNEKISVIAFSKDRPLQLQAYIESLIYFSQNVTLDITIIYKESLEINYEELVRKFPAINWIKEVSFFNNLLDAIEKSSDFIMFGCDDVIFKGYIDFAHAKNVLKKNENIFGFSLRLGKNIKGMPAEVEIFGAHLEWNWNDNNAASWNYPWELDCTIYRKNDVKEILSNLIPGRIKTPNYLESDIASNPLKFVNKPKLAAFLEGKCIVLTVNRVQDDFGNTFDNSLKTDVKMLYQLYKDDCKIDFLKIAKKKNKRIHVGAEYFLLSGKRNAYTTLELYLMAIVRKLLTLFKRMAFK